MQRLTNWRALGLGFTVSFIVAAIYAAAYFAETWGEQYGYGADNQQVLATIVADQNPGYFDADPVLGDSRNYEFYRTAFTSLVEWTYQWLGNPGQVYGLLAIPFNALRVFGFFLLGWWLFRSPGWAIVLALASVIEIPFERFSERWGIVRAMYARAVFESLFPYLLLGAITAGASVRRQILVMAACGFATYLHPVSGPPVAFALWAAMATRVGGATVAGRLRNAFVAGLAYALVILPFFVHFGSQTSFGQPLSGPLEAALRNIFPEYLNLEWSVFKQLTSVKLILVIGLATVALIAAWWRGERRVVEFLVVFSAVLMFATIVAPITEQRIAAALGRIPLEIDFVRAAKYLVPIAEISLVWCAKLVWQGSVIQGRLAARRGFVVGSALVLLSLYPATFGTLSYASCRAREFFTAQCASPQIRADTTAMYSAIERAVPKGHLVLLAAEVGQLHAYGIRIYSRRPVAWSWKEGGILAYTNPAALLEWYSRRRALESVQEMTGGEKSTAMAQLMEKWAVRYLVISADDPLLSDLSRLGRVVYNNSIGYLIELRNQSDKSESTSIN